MTSLDETRDIGTAVDATFHYGGIMVRAVGYLIVAAIADRYCFGQAILTGVLIGDLSGQLIKSIVRWHEGPLMQIGELLMIGIVYLFVRPMLGWPDDAALRAIIGLAAFGVLSGHIGGSVLMRLGPSPA